MMLQTKYFKKLRIFLLCTFVLELFSYGLWSFMHGPDLLLIDYYSEKSNYEEQKFIILSNRGSFKFELKEPQDAYYDQSFVIAMSNQDILTRNSFFKEVKAGDVFYGYTSSRLFGDGWDYPIVSVRSFEKEYLSFDTGVQNLLEEYEAKEDKANYYLRLIITATTINIFLLLFCFVRGKRKR